MGWQDRAYNREETGHTFGRRAAGMTVTQWLMLVNVVIFLVDSVLFNATRGGYLAPRLWAGFSIEKGVFGLQLWRWFTYQFVHSSFFHILFNMIGLYFFGRLMEQWWGSRRFLAFYLICGASGAVVFTLLAFVPGLLDIRPTDTLVGASGSVFGILVGCALVFPHQRVMLLIPPIPMSMRTLALVFLGIAVFSVIVNGGNAPGEAAHLGGAVMGLALIKFPGLLGFSDHPILKRRHRGPGRFQRKMEKLRRTEEAEQLEVDRILDKVRASGLNSLTRGEKKVLQRATERQRNSG